MAVFSPRPRLISFRLSHLDYERLRALASAHGAHSLSDYIRDCMWQVIHRHGFGEDSIVPAGNAAADPSRAAIQTRSTVQSTPPAVFASELRAVIDEVDSLRRKTNQLDGLVNELAFRIMLTSARHASGKDHEQRSSYASNEAQSTICG